MQKGYYIMARSSRKSGSFPFTSSGGPQRTYISAYESKDEKSLSMSIYIMTLLEEHTDFLYDDIRNTKLKCVCKSRFSTIRKQPNWWLVNREKQICEAKGIKYITSIHKKN